MSSAELFLVTETAESKSLIDFVLINSQWIHSKKGFKKALKKEKIKVNNKLGSERLEIKKGDQIEVLPPDLLVTKIFPLKLKVHFEDEFIAVVEKPAGIPTSGNYYKTLLNALPFNLQPSSLYHEKNFYPVHRLDRSTSGLIIIAKSIAIASELHKVFETQKITKCYRAFVHGKLPTNGTIDLQIDQKECVTDYHTIENFESKRFGALSLCELFPKTGRTHQLRKHLSQIGHPILGDALYCQFKTPRDKGLFLQAYGLNFRHPTTQAAIEIIIEAPNKFNWIRKN